MTYPVIKEPGIKKLGDLPDDKLDKPTLDRSAASTLTDLLPEYAFFTPAAMYLYLRLDRDPIHQFYQEQGRDPDLKTLYFDSPVFSGFTSDQGNNSWDHTLFAAKRDTWPKLLSFLGSLAICDRKADIFARIRTRRVPVLDQFQGISADVSGKLKGVYVTVLCLDTNRGCVYVKGINDGTDWLDIDNAAERPKDDRFETADIRFLKHKPEVIRTKDAFPDTLALYKAWKKPDDDEWFFKPATSYSTKTKSVTKEEHEYMKRKFGEPLK